MTSGHSAPGPAATRAGLRSVPSAHETRPPLTWRAPTVADAAAWARLRAAVEAEDRTGETYTDDDVAEELARPVTDPGTHAWFAFTPAGDAVAWGWVHYVARPTRHRRVFLDGAVHPAWRGRGVGDELVRWLVARGDDVLGGASDGPPGWLELRADTRDDARAALFARHGFTPLRHFLELRRPLGTPVPAVAPPPGVEIVRYTRDLDAELRVAHNEAFRDNWGSDERDEQAWRRWFTGSRHFRADLSFLALDGGAIAGYALSAVYEEDAPGRGFTEAWTTNVGTRKPWRGRGIARTVLARCLDAYAAAGFEYASLDVDSANPSGALRLYRDLGYETVRDVVSWARGPRGTPVTST
jgi:ribosomal protein S18 acetylase RimI-like enzyme